MWLLPHPHRLPASDGPGRPLFHVNNDPGRTRGPSAVLRSYESEALGGGVALWPAMAAPQATLCVELSGVLLKISPHSHHL